MTIILAKNVSPEDASVTVESAMPSDAALVDAYIDQHSDGTVFHRPGWAKAAKIAYGYETTTLVAWRGGEVVGLAPLTDVRAPLLGRSLVSTGFTVGGGPIANDADILAMLADEAAAQGEARGANYVELRSDPPLGSDWLKKSGVYAGFELPIPVDENENLAMVPRKRRAEVRKAIKAVEAGDLSVRIIRNTVEFYSLYAAALRDHGTPVFPKRFLDTLVQAFADNVEISIADWRGQPVAALLSFYDKDTVRPYYIGALPAARSARAAEYLYWSQMRRAAERGCVRFDFGRSKVGTGPYNFKKLWGAEPRPLTYRIRLIRADAAPDINPNNPKFATFVSLWRRLPLPVANRIGPMIAGNFP